MASWAPEMPDPNAGDDLAYAEAWENRIQDEELARLNADADAAAIEAGADPAKIATGPLAYPPNEDEE